MEKKFWRKSRAIILVQICEMCDNHKLDLVNMNPYTKYGETRIVRKSDYSPPAALFMQ